MKLTKKDLGKLSDVIIAHMTHIGNLPVTESLQKAIGDELKKLELLNNKINGLIRKW